MQPFNLSLGPRLALAVLSGLLTYPAILIDSALGPLSYPPIFPWWIILHGAIFGVLVLVPFIASDRHRTLRAVALVVASVVSYDAAIKIPDLIDLNLPGDLGDFIVAGVSGALLVATAVRFIAPLRAGLPYWSFTFLAGAIGGFVFAMTFDVCDWDNCSSPGLILVYASGWAAWQSLVCGALFVGSQRSPAEHGAYGASVR